ncbi:hypothetical protein [Halovivax gelatinilyticus]|uniref:hypothetical protein n=1 Tax=Halovivax gelatinilyticus TaxID=2961597 RepID=UPI0020CA9273|nr:hypothetical protein [Halovivax gelatinilyticus]
MDTVWRQFDSRFGVVGLLVLVSLLAGFIVVSDAVLSGDRVSVWYFIAFVVALVAAFVGGTVGWQRIKSTE